MKAGKKHKRKTGILVGVCITVLIVTALLYFVYGKELVGCNDEKEVLSKYIYEIEKEKVKDLLRKILWEGAIRYVEG